MQNIATTALGGGAPAVQATANVGKEVTTGVVSKGDSQEVEAKTVGKVIGKETNQKAETIVNESIPTWVVWALVVLSAMNIVFLCLPTPTQIWNKIRRH